MDGKQVFDYFTCIDYQQKAEKYRYDNKDSCFRQKHAEDISGTGTTAFMHTHPFGTTI